MPAVSGAFFYLLPGFGFGIEANGKNYAYRIEKTVSGLKQLAIRASRLICGIDEPQSSFSGVNDEEDDANRLYYYWRWTVGGPLRKHALIEGNSVSSLDLGHLTSGTNGVRQPKFRALRENLLVALECSGCSVVPDEIPHTESPVHFLTFCRHPYLLSENWGVIGEGKGANPTDAEMGMLCEGIERMVAMKPDYERSLVGYSANSLRNQGIAVPRIEAGMRDCFADELFTDWVEAKLYPNTQASLPAELVWFHYVPLSGFRAFDMRHTIGLAAGATEAEAFSNGLLECIERDAYALFMRCRLSCPAIAFQDIEACGEHVAALLKQLDAEGIEVHFKWLQLDYSLPIAHVFFRDRLNRIPAHSHGCSAALTPTHAISRALFEAVQMHHGLSRFATVPAHWEKMAARIETAHSHPRYAWGDPLYSNTLQHLANTPETTTTIWPAARLSIEDICAHLNRSGRRIFWTVLGEVAGLTVVRVFLEGSVSPDNRHEDGSKRLADWVRRCKLPGPYTDPILT